MSLRNEYEKQKSQTPSSCIKIRRPCILGYSLPTMHLNRSVKDVTGHEFTAIFAIAICKS